MGEGAAWTGDSFRPSPESRPPTGQKRRAPGCPGALSSPLPFLLAQDAWRLAYPLSADGTASRGEQEVTLARFNYRCSIAVLREPYGRRATAVVRLVLRRR